jgi:hypothetical protein
MQQSTDLLRLIVTDALRRRRHRAKPSPYRSLYGSHGLNTAVRYIWRETRTLGVPEISTSLPATYSRSGPFRKPPWTLPSG